MLFILIKSSIFVNFVPKKYNKCMKLLVREQIKTLLAQESIKLKDLAAMITEQTGKNCAPNVLSRKLSRGTLSYNETLMIAELLDYEIAFIKKNSTHD